MESDLLQRVNESAKWLAGRVPTELLHPAVGIVCGSGLGRLSETVRADPCAAISYKDIPHFPESTAPGHEGRLVFGYLGRKDKPVVLMVGRLHYYEGHSIQEITFPVRLMKHLGVKTLIVTNAAGGLNPEYSVGDVMLLNDHINLAGLAGNHPLRGPNVEDFGVRFPALSDAYDLGLRRRAHQIWTEAGGSRKLHEGVYAFVGGPSYETRAECRLLKLLGADAVGMSTVPEVTVARHSGVRVLALSLVTNNCVLDPGPRGDQDGVQNLNPRELEEAMKRGKANHEEVLDAASNAESDIQYLVSHLAEEILAEDL